MKWNKDIIIQELINIKNRDGQVNCGHIHENYTPLRGAVYRYFDSFDQALECAGFDPFQETKSSTFSEETRKKISQSRLGKYKGKDNPMYGKSHAKESKELMIQKLKERHASDPDWQSGSKNHMFGKKQTNESNKKRSDTLKAYNSQFEKRPYKLTPEGRQKIQNGRAKAISQQKSSSTDIELIIKTSLDELKIEYEFQHGFPYFCVDFYLTKHDCVLWCDGDYWHANPEVYKVLTARQKTQRRLDKSQESYLNNRKVRFIRMWGSDIKNSLSDCENKILNLIKEIK
jgi:G:T-mismatch repair DNA endonuclease (very short patch repair protein)